MIHQSQFTKVISKQFNYHNFLKKSTIITWTFQFQNLNETKLKPILISTRINSIYHSIYSQLYIMTIEQISKIQLSFGTGESFSYKKSEKVIDIKES